jgi:hypothetical protein
MTHEEIQKYADQLIQLTRASFILKEAEIKSRKDSDDYFITLLCAMVNRFRECERYIDGFDSDHMHEVDEALEVGADIHFVTMSFQLMDNHGRWDQSYEDILNNNTESMKRLQKHRDFLLKDAQGIPMEPASE